MHPASFRLRGRAVTHPQSSVQSRAKTSKPVNFTPRQHLSKKDHKYCALKEGALKQQEGKSVLSCEGKGFEFYKAYSL